jgi:hypothetical protein
VRCMVVECQRSEGNRKEKSGDARRETDPSVHIANGERPVASEESERRLAAKNERVLDLDVCVPGPGSLAAPARAQSSGGNFQS